MPRSKEKADKQKTRKNLRKRVPAEKRQSRQQKLHKRLKQYSDYDAEKFKAAEHLPRVFHCGVDEAGQWCCAVIVNWSMVAKRISRFSQKMMQDSEAWKSLTSEELERVTLSADRNGLVGMFIHVLPTLPQRLRLSLDRLCYEAVGVTLKRMDQLRARHESRGRQSNSSQTGKEVFQGIAAQTWFLRELLDTLLKVEEISIKNDLEIHRGPPPRFRDDTDYQQSLRDAAAKVLNEGKKLTQGNIAEALGRDNEEATLDEDTIKRWNKEFGVNWKAFKKSLKTVT